MGRQLVNGPLLKCAIAGDDPNVGRVVAKVGQILGARGKADLLDESSPAVVKLGGEVIFEDGQFALDGVAQGGFTGTSQLVESRLRATEIKQRAYDELASSA